MLDGRTRHLVLALTVLTLVAGTALALGAGTSQTNEGNESNESNESNETNATNQTNETNTTGEGNETPGNGTGDNESAGNGTAGNGTGENASAGPAGGAQPLAGNPPDETTRRDAYLVWGVLVGAIAVLSAVAFRIG